MSKFVKTSDEVLAEKLRTSGMTCVGFENDTKQYVFLNDGKLPVMFEDNTELHFSDMLMF